MNVLVTGTSPGVICVCGTAGVQDGRCTIPPSIVRVRVLAGSVSPPLPPAVPSQPGDVDTIPAGGLWTALNVPVPGSSPTGVPITVVAWQALAGVWGTPQSVMCNAGGTGATSCCGQAAVGEPELHESCAT